MKPLKQLKQWVFRFLGIESSFVIVIDPGHGGNHIVGGSSPNNATGRNGTKEKDLTLSIGIKVAEILNQRRHEVHLTRNDDYNVGLKDRALVAVNNNADVFVSIHFNGDNHPQTQGTETWVHNGASKNSKALASSILHRLAAATGYRNRGVKSDDFLVLEPSIHSMRTAATLAEISFLTDPADEDRLAKAAYKMTLAAAIGDAIEDYLNNRSGIRLEPVTIEKNAEELMM